MSYSKEFSLNVNEIDAVICFQLAINIASIPGTSDKTTSGNDSKDNLHCKNNLENFATKYELSRGQIKDMKSVFTV